MTDGPHAQWERAITSAPPARFQQLTDGPASAAGVFVNLAQDVVSPFFFLLYSLSLFFSLFNF
jgi:hypothetical protein